MSEKKLKQLYTELKVHDKEVMSLKKLKADNMDKDGLREAEIRKSFNGIMFAYGLTKPSTFDENSKNVSRIHSVVLLLHQQERTPS